jgi:hypothetical protein
MKASLASGMAALFLMTVDAGHLLALHATLAKRCERVSG